MESQRNMRGMHEEKEFEEKVVQVNRVSKKTKNGNNVGFSVLVVVGDKKGKVGVGLGKGKDVLSAIKKGVKKAKKKLLTVPTNGTTIPFAVTVKLGAAHIVLKPAPVGSGIIAGGPVRAVVDAAGIRDISSKIKGTNNQASNVYATFAALKKIRALVDVKNIKLKSLADVQKEEKEKEIQEMAKKKENMKKEADIQAKVPAQKKVVKPVKKEVKPVEAKPEVKQEEKKPVEKEVETVETKKEEKKEESHA